MSTPHPVAKYLGDQAKHLRKAAQGSNPVSRSGAIWRIRNHLPAFARVPDADVPQLLRSKDAKHVIASEQNASGWTDLLRQLGAAESGPEAEAPTWPPRPDSLTALLDQEMDPALGPDLLAALEARVLTTVHDAFSHLSDGEAWTRGELIRVLLKWMLSDLLLSEDMDAALFHEAMDAPIQALFASRAPSAAYYAAAEHSEPLYELCMLCDHFVETSDQRSVGGAAVYAHLDDDEQEHDHDAAPSGERRTLPEWKTTRPDLFKMHLDGAVGPNSRWHREVERSPGNLLADLVHRAARLRPTAQKNTMAIAGLLAELAGDGAVDLACGSEPIQLVLEGGAVYRASLLYVQDGLPRLYGWPVIDPNNQSLDGDPEIVEVIDLPHEKAGRLLDIAVHCPLRALTDFDVLDALSTRATEDTQEIEHEITTLELEREYIRREIERRGPSEARTEALRVTEENLGIARRRLADARAPK